MMYDYNNNNSVLVLVVIPLAIRVHSQQQYLLLVLLVPALKSKQHSTATLLDTRHSPDTSASATDTNIASNTN